MSCVWEETCICFHCKYNTMNCGCTDCAKDGVDPYFYGDCPLFIEEDGEDEKGN